MDMEILMIGLGAMTLITMLVLLTVAVVAYLQYRRTEGEPGTLQTLSHLIQQQQTQIAMLGEKLSHIEPVTQVMGMLNSEMRGLTERISTVEVNQNEVQRGVGSLATDSISALSELKTLTNRLGEATAVMRSELALAKTDLTELHSHVRSRQEMDIQMSESIRRLETVIAGTQSKGSAGENILDVVFGKLPPEWQVRNFKISGKVVEFGLRLPNDLILPIDSKWTATHLLEKFIASEDVEEKQRIKRDMEGAVLLKAKEVKKYIDPSVTVNFGVAVIPDSIFDLTYSIQSEAFRMNVVLVSYSMFVPYLLLVFQTMLRTTQSIDLQKIEAYLQTVQESTQAIQEELDGRFSRAITMLSNSRDDMRAMISKAGSSLTALQLAEIQRDVTTIPQDAIPEERWGATRPFTDIPESEMEDQSSRS